MGLFHVRQLLGKQQLGHHVHFNLILDLNQFSKGSKRLFKSCPTSSSPQDLSYLTDCSK